MINYTIKEKRGWAEEVFGHLDERNKKDG